LFSETQAIFFRAFDEMEMHTLVPAEPKQSLANFDERNFLSRSAYWRVTPR
jgi:hypothetical protein